MKHTPEPWKMSCIMDYVDDANGNLIAVVYPWGDSLQEIRKANSARIIACVNAMSGIEEPATEIKNLQGHKKILLDLLQQLPPVLKESTLKKISDLP